MIIHRLSANPAAKRKKEKIQKKKRVRFNGSIVGGLTITIVVISLSIVLATSAISLGMEYLGINKTANEITFNIPEGSNNDEIADILVSKNIITNKDLFKAALKIKKPAALYPGDITLRPNMSYPDIIENLATMRESYETVSVTIPEGATLLQVAKSLRRRAFARLTISSSSSMPTLIWMLTRRSPTAAMHITLWKAISSQIHMSFMSETPLSM